MPIRLTSTLKICRYTHFLKFWFSWSRMSPGQYCFLKSSSTDSNMQPRLICSKTGNFLGHMLLTLQSCPQGRHHQSVPLSPDMALASFSAQLITQLVTNNGSEEPMEPPLAAVCERFTPSPRQSQQSHLWFGDQFCLHLHNLESLTLS